MDVKYLPCLLMILQQFAYAGMSILAKIAMDSGMNAIVLVAYRQIIATLVLSPVAYFLEWATSTQCLYFLGLKYSTPTIAGALINPAVTFIMAVPFGMESVGIKHKSGIAKVLGTTLSIGGAMLMIFFKGNVITFIRSGIDWTYTGSITKSGVNGDEHSFLGPLLVIGSCCAGAGWLIVQCKIGQAFPAPYTSSSLMCLMASFECVVIAVSQEHSGSGWSLASKLRLTASIYSGAVGSAISFSIISWCVQKRGPLYVSMFSPLTLVLVAIASWALLDEKQFLGTGVGSVLIVMGLFTVLWGKMKEKKQVSTLDESRDEAV